MVVGTLLDGITSLGSKVFDLTRAMTKAGDALQKASLALGSDFRTMNTQLKPSMDGLRGTIEQRFGAAFATLEAGLQGNTAGISKLINQQQLTGTQYQQTAKAFAKLEFALDLSREESNELATRVRDLGAEFNVSTDKLVESISDLKATFPAQKLAGMGKETMEAVATLRAEIPALGEELNAVMRMVFDPSFGTFGQLTALGIGNVREQLANNKDVNAQVEILKNAIATASTSVSQLAAGSKDQFTNIQIAKEVGSETALLFGLLNDELGERARNPDPMLDFAKTIETLKAEVWVPFKMFFVRDVFPVVIEVADVFSFIGQEITAAFMRLLPNLDMTTENFKLIKVSVLEFSIKFISALEGVTNMLVQFGSKVLPSLLDAIVGVVNFINSSEFLMSDQRKEKLAERGRLTAQKEFTEEMLRGGTLWHAERMARVQQMDFNFLSGKERTARAGEFGRLARGGGTIGNLAKINEAIAALDKELAPASVTGMPKFEESMLNVINDEDSQLIKNLKGALIELKLGNDLSIARNNSLEDLNRKTIDPFEEATTSEYLSSQSRTVGMMMESILGVTPQNADEQAELMKIQTQYLKAISEKGQLVGNPMGF